MLQIQDDGGLCGEQARFGNGGGRPTERPIYATPIDLNTPCLEGLDFAAYEVNAAVILTSLGGNPDCQAPDKLAKIIKMGHPTNMDELAEIERLAAPRNASQPSTFGDIPRLRHREIRQKLPLQAPPVWRPEMKSRTP
jgi:hypothetical protein